MNADRGWLGMFASLDYMHYCWKKCPIAWQGSFIDKDGNTFIILEGITNRRLWIWHTYFGLPKGNNDLIVLNRSLLIPYLLGGGASFDLQFWGKWQCTSSLLLACRWDLSSMVLFCTHHTWTTRRKMLTFFQNVGGNLQRCWTLFQCIVIEVVDCG